MRETQERTLVTGFHYSRERLIEDAKLAAIDREIRRGEKIEVGDDWEIWNAPRPLHGHHHWNGPFLSGIFYVGIDPAGDYAEQYREENRKLDARLLRWVSYEEAFEKVRWYYGRLIEEGEIDMAEFSEGEIVRCYFQVKDREEPY